MELANYAELSNYELNEINGGNGVIGKVYYVGAATAAGAIEGAEICAILGPEGAVAGAIGLGYILVYLVILAGLYLTICHKIFVC
jgi:hypothetical protein